MLLFLQDLFSGYLMFGRTPKIYGLLKLAVRSMSCDINTTNHNLVFQKSLIMNLWLSKIYEYLSVHKDNYDSLQFSFSVVSDSLWHHWLQHARLPCLSPTSRAYSISCPLRQWCHPTISSVVPFPSRLQSFPASGPSNESVLHIR